MRAAVLAFSLASCAPMHSPASSERIPGAVYRAVQFRTAEGLGWGTPVQDGRLLTVAHIAGGPGAWRHYATSGAAVELWADRKRDFAVYEIDRGRLALVPVGGKPEERELLWWRFYLQPGHVPAVGSGAFLGVDDEGDYHIDGMSMPGGSGSPVVNARGEIVAVVSAGFNQSVLERPGMDSPEAVARLFLRTSFRPVVVAKPLNGRVPKRAE